MRGALAQNQGEYAVEGMCGDKVGDLEVQFGDVAGLFREGDGLIN